MHEKYENLKDFIIFIEMLSSQLNITIEAARQEQINQAAGEAAAVVAVSEARAKGLQVVASALTLTDAKNAAALSVAEQYVNAFNKLAKVNNTLILPSNVGDVSTLVAQVCYLNKLTADYLF